MDKLGPIIGALFFTVIFLVVVFAIGSMIVGL